MTSSTGPRSSNAVKQAILNLAGFNRGMIHANGTLFTPPRILAPQFGFRCDEFLATKNDLISKQLQDLLPSNQPLQGQRALQQEQQIVLQNGWYASSKLIDNQNALNQAIAELKVSERGTDSYRHGFLMAITSHTLKVQLFYKYEPKAP